MTIRLAISRAFSSFQQVYLRRVIYPFPVRGALGAAGRQLSDHSNNRESSLDDSGVVDDHDDGEHTSDDQAPHAPHPRRAHLHPPLLIQAHHAAQPPPPTHVPTPHIQQVNAIDFRE